MTLDQALSVLQDTVTAITASTTVSLTESLDRVLASDVCAAFSVPQSDNSAMDGYALRAEDLDNTDSLQLIGKALAGAPFDAAVSAGQCVRITTGAVIPAGCNCVVMQEQTNPSDNRVHFNVKPIIHENIRHAGEDIQQGEIILSAGTRLKPADIGLLASLGYAKVSVYRRLKVALFSTGDELRLPGQPLEPGTIYDSNRFVVAAMLSRLAIDVLNLGIIPDCPERLREAFTTAAQDCDAIISTGGVSVGEADYTKTILQELGEIGFWKIAIKPGKPFAFGHINNSLFFGLPGNPVAATITCHQLVIPALQRLAGEQYKQPISLQLPSATALKKQPGRIDFQRGILSLNDHNKAQVTTTGSQGSGILTSMSKANCYIKLPSDCTAVSTQEPVEVIPFDRWIS